MYKLTLKDRHRLKFIRDNFNTIRQFNNTELNELAQKFQTDYRTIVDDIETISFTKFNMKYYK